MASFLKRSFNDAAIKIIDVMILSPMKRVINESQIMEKGKHSELKILWLYRGRRAEIFIGNNNINNV